ncbi:hypothetical protein BIW11_03732 [Tropilaelaps mercedesae]|uniref:Uncharacterized protein n=1 Tax=Tropilaelaps mercedesae TaxID=418985 RepID=A0A1V9XH21_9ACAR|nr:hypothetical protein BIW11_03732 [Tropilaelaps mercedesae]
MSDTLDMFSEPTSLVNELDNILDARSDGTITPQAEHDAQGYTDDDYHDQMELELPLRKHTPQTEARKRQTCAKTTNNISDMLTHYPSDLTTSSRRVDNTTRPGHLLGSTQSECRQLGGGLVPLTKSSLLDTEVLRYGKQSQRQKLTKQSPMIRPEVRCCRPLGLCVAEDVSQLSVQTL